MYDESRLNGSNGGGLHGNNIKGNYPTSTMLNRRDDETVVGDSQKSCNDAFSIADDEVSSSGRSHQPHRQLSHGNEG